MWLLLHQDAQEKGQRRTDVEAGSAALSDGSEMMGRTNESYRNSIGSQL